MMKLKKKINDSSFNNLFLKFDCIDMYDNKSKKLWEYSL